MRSNALHSLAIIISAFVYGCSGSTNPETVPVTGTVTLDGQPLEGAQVTFMAKNAPRAAIGTTDAQGHFSLTTFEPDDGAIPGTHIVTFSKVEKMASTENANYTEMMQKQKGKSPPKPKSLIPEKYSRARDSETTATVNADGENEFKFDLKK